MTSDKNDGGIKFKYNLKVALQLKDQDYIDLEKWRVILFKMNLIGENSTKNVSFGNLSKRAATNLNEFIITGTQTGKSPHLTNRQYTRVTKCDHSKMTIDSVGPIAPSTQSQIHHLVYANCPQVQAIFHVQHPELWNYVINNGLDATAKNISYNSQEIEDEMSKCIGNKLQGIFAIQAEKDMLMAYGSSPEEAGKVILETLKESRK